jgi:hypothetical protein
MTKGQEAAVRNYLLSLKDPSALTDRDQIADLQTKLEQTQDELERLQIRQQLLDIENPPLHKYEEEFITHAKAWADDKGISEDAFLAEGVDPQVLRKAGFRVGRGTRGRGASARSRGGRRQRVSAEDVRAAIPKGSFTISRLQDASGASPAVVRRVVQEEVDAGRVQEEGKDPDHRGPGRAPTLYRR